MAYLKFVPSIVMAASLHCANQSAGLSGQKGGRRTASLCAATPVVLSAASCTTVCSDHVGFTNCVELRRVPARCSSGSRLGGWSLVPGGLPNCERCFSAARQPTNQKDKSGAKRRRETSSLARPNHSCVRNALLEMVNGALN
jgi:hypothetical protein